MIPSFLLIALLAGLAASITGGIMGTYVVARRILSIAGSISHSVLGGMGLFLWLKRTYGIDWLTPIGGALLAALLSAFLIGWIRLNYRERTDTVIALIWSTGMAIGVIFISLTPGYNVEMMDFLFGNILWVTKQELLFLILLDIFLAGSAYLFHSRFLAICFDEEHAKLQNINVKAFFIFLLCLVAVSVVLLIQIVGAILVIAMLAIPAAIASTYSHHMPKIMLLSILFGALFTFIGTSVAFILNWPPGATIALTASLLYVLRHLTGIAGKRGNKVTAQ